VDLVPPRSGRIAHALGAVRRTLEQALAAEPAAGPRAGEPIPILLAWSGGPDSAALLGLVELLTRPLGLAIVVGHVDHGLRAASADEAALVVATARARGHAVLVDRLELAPGPGLAARARDLRRAALVRQAQACGASVVVLGHTATDLAETMLLHLCRGAGLGGLSPMPSVRPWIDESDRSDSDADPKPDAAPRRCASGIVVRPLLHLTRTDTRAIATELAIPFVDDPTNLDDAHPRVAIRERVLPILRAINPEIEAHFGALAHVARDAEQALAHAANELLARALTEPDTLDVHALRSVPRAVRVHAMRSFCLRRGVPPDALHERTLAAIEAVVAGEGREPARARRWDLHPHRTLSLAGGRLRLEPAQSGPEGRGESPAHEPAPMPAHARPRPGGPKRNGPNH
jgi:tRNA(Ile)-lysidine synthase